MADVVCSLHNFAPTALLDQLSGPARQQLAGQFGDAFRAELIRLAQEGLTRTRADYMAAIQPVTAMGSSASVALAGDLPNAIEEGQPAYDMHDTLLGDNVPTVPVGGGRGKHPRKKGGFYRAIPFRHQGPDSEGLLGTPMGQAHTKMMGQQAAHALGKTIHDHAKDLTGTRGGPYKLKVGKNGKVTSQYTKPSATRWGGRLPAGLAPVMPHAVQVPGMRTHHATDIYAGMVRMQKTYQKATQSYYMTFRTISTGSPGWRRNAVPGKNFFGQAQKFIEQIGVDIVNAFLEGISGKPQP